MIRALAESDAAGLLVGFGTACHVTGNNQGMPAHAPYFLLRGKFDFVNGSQSLWYSGQPVMINGLDSSFAHASRELPLDSIDVNNTFSSLPHQPLILIDCSWSGNFFHFMLDVLGKLSVAEKFIDLSNCRVLFNQWQPFHKEAFKLLRLSCAWIGYDQAYSGRILVPSLLANSNIASRDHVLWLRRAFDHVPADSEFRYLYISRGKSKRSVMNEDALLDGLRLIAPFEKVSLGELGLCEQIALFKGASVVVGSHGAGLVLSAFMKEGSALVEFFGPHYCGNHFRDLAFQSNLAYHSSRVVDSGRSASQAEGWDSDFSANISEICDLIHI